MRSIQEIKKMNEKKEKKVIIPRAMPGHCNSGAMCEEEKREYWKWYFAGRTFADCACERSPAVAATMAIEYAKELIEQLEETQK